MNSRLTLIILLLLFSYQLFAQISDSLSNYYYYVNQAEVLNTENNFVGAEKKYERAAEYKSDWFAKDYYNRSLLKIKLEQEKELYPILAKLIAKGFELDLLLEKESFQKYFSTKRGQKDFEKLKSIIPSYNVELRSIYDSLKVQDSIGQSQFNPEIFSHVVGTIDSSNVYLVLKLMEEYYFPSENK